MTAYVDTLKASYTTPGSTSVRRGPLTSLSDFTRECFVCDIRSASSLMDGEEAPRHCATDAQRRARLDEIAKAKRQPDDELAKLHQALGMRNGNATHSVTRCVNNTASIRTSSGITSRTPERPRPRDQTPPARTRARDMNRCINEDAVVNGGEAPLFKRVLQNLAAVAMLLHSCPKPATLEERSMRH